MKVGKETPASGSDGSAVAVAGVSVGVSVGASVGADVGSSVGASVGASVGSWAPMVNARVLQDCRSGAAAAGSEVGAVGATGSCLN